MIASTDEWYKAAYGNLNGTWSNYPTGSDSAPTAVSSGTATNTAVYGGITYGVSGPADISNAGGLSPWGTMGQGGNVWEWNETAYDGTNNSADENRDLRGGIWYYSFFLDASARLNINPTNEDVSTGFRVASVPEPSSLSLL